jgi:hypothetical protein
MVLGAPARELAIGAALASAVALYFYLLPHHLGESDEAYYLYHAKRVLDGQVPHRDFYELHMTLPYYLMAAAFGVFGMHIATAAAVSGLIQGLITWTVYAAARALGARAGFALLAAAAHLAVDVLAWPYGSPHWFASLVLTVLLAWLVSRRARRPRDWFVAGALVGLLGVIQHQNAAVTALALLALLAVDGRLASRASPTAPFRARLVAYLAGCALVPLPYLLVHVALAGLDDVVEQVIVYPLIGYRAQLSPPRWASANFMTAYLTPYTCVPFLTWVPAVLPLALGRAVLAGRRGNADLSWRLGAAVVVAGAASVSILYQPDFIHVAFVMPLYLPLVAESVQWVTGEIGTRWRPAGALGPAVQTVLALLLVLQIGLNARRFQSEWTAVADTQFGRLATRTVSHRDEIARVAAAARARGTSELFSYPIFPLLYLTTGTDNPTRHDMVFGTMNSPTHYAEIEAVLDAHQTPLVHLMAELTGPADAGFLEYLERHYRCAEPVPPGETPPAKPGRHCRLYERLAAAP